MNHDEISQLAREIVSEIIPDLERVNSLIFVEELGEPILVVTAGSSVLRFNPLRWAEKYIREHFLNVGLQHREAAGNIEAQRRMIIRDSKKDLIQLLCAVDLMLGDALWMVEHLSGAMTVDYELGPFWQNVQVGVKWSTLQVIDGRLREILNLPGKSLTVKLAEKDEMMGGNYDYAITDIQMIAALKQLEQFSINKLAKLLAPEREDFRKSVYDWMRRKGIDRSELERWWKKMRRTVEKSE